MPSTHDIRVAIITEKWSKPYKREDGTWSAEGWTKPMGWPKRGSQRPDGDINSFSRSAIQAYRETSLYKALTTRASVPAYFVGYAPNKIGLRLRKDAVSPLFSGMTEDGGGVQMHLLLMDVDNHEENADIETWWESELDKIANLLEIHPGLIIYRSRRGYRIIGLLKDTVHIKSAADSNTWDRSYTAWCNYLKRRFQINADVLLDWTRFQAVPHQKKDRDEPALELEVIGNVEEIGYWNPELDASDWPPEKKTSGYDGVSTFEGESQLYQLINLAGLRCEATEYANVYDICCPNWTAHSPDSRGLQDYPSKTVLYTNGPIGKIECKSAGCYRSHPNRNTDYFKHFRPEDVERTRPKPPIDVWDPIVLKMANERNRLCDSVTLAKLLSCTDLSDPGYESYVSAINMQTRLQKKS